MQATHSKLCQQEGKEHGKEEEGFTHQDTADPYDGSWGDNRIQYPAV